MRNFFVWLDHWQTLVSGVLAIVAAVGGAALVFRQIAQADKHERDRLRRRSNAVRATLPLTLSGLVSFVSEALKKLIDVRKNLPDHHVGPLPPGFDPPAPPSDLVESLKDMIEATDDETIVSIISLIVAEVQTLTSRMNSLNDPVRMSNAVGVDINVEEYIIQAAILNSIIEGLFDFARRKKSTGPSSVSWDRVYSVLIFMHVDEVEFPKLFATLKRRESQSDFAWKMLRG